MAFIFMFLLFTLGNIWFSAGVLAFREGEPGCGYVGIVGGFVLEFLGVAVVMA